MSAAADDLADFLSGFHSIALVAYVLVAAETGQWPPDRELTRRRAYDLYEQELRRKHERIRLAPSPDRPYNGAKETSDGRL